MVWRSLPQRTDSNSESTNPVGGSRRTSSLEHPGLRSIPSVNTLAKLCHRARDLTSGGRSHNRINRRGMVWLGTWEGRNPASSTHSPTTMTIRLNTRGIKIVMQEIIWERLSTVLLGGGQGKPEGPRSPVGRITQQPNVNSGGFCHPQKK